MKADAITGAVRPMSDSEQARIDGFIAALAARGRASKTLSAYRSDHGGFCEAHAAADGRPVDVVALGGGWASAVEAYVAALGADGAKAATVNRKLVMLKRYADWLGARGDIEAAAVDAVRAIKPVSQPRRRPRGLSDIELRRFLREVERRGGARDRAIVHVLLSTGLRVGELVELAVEQVTVGGRRGVVLVDDARGFGQRRLSLTPDARRALGAYLAARGDASGPLFVGERGPLTANAIQRIVRKYCAFAKVKASPGTLRHTFAQSFLHDTGDLVELADLLGHESLETTRLYLPGPAETAPAPSHPTRPRMVAGGEG